MIGFAVPNAIETSADSEAEKDGVRRRAAKTSDTEGKEE